MLIEIDEGAASKVDDVRLEISATAAALLPPSWRLREGGRGTRLEGPSTQPPLRFRLLVASAPAQLRITLRHQGKTWLDQRIKVAALPAVEVATATRGLLAFPPVVSPGETIEIGVLDRESTPADGRWTIAGVVAERAGEHLRLRLPATLATGAPVAIAYTDSWGEQTVNIPAAEGLWVAPPPAQLDPAPRITGCNTRVFLGDALCVCGYFPGNSADGLLVDGRPVRAIASSLRAVYLPMGDQLSPGQHEVSGKAESGFVASDRRQSTVVRLVSRIDNSQLFRQQGTNIHIELEGTSEPIPVQIWNHTPRVLAPARFPVLYTSGGTPNVVSAGVRGIGVGRFRLDPKPTGSRCPCAGDDEEEAPAPAGAPPSASQPRRLLVPQQVTALIALAPVPAIEAAAQAIAGANGLAVLEIAPLPSTGDALILFQILDGQDALQKAAVLSADPRVRLAQPNFLHFTTAQMAGPDPQLQYGPRLIGADQLRQTLTGAGVRLALLDSGVDGAHPELQRAIAEQADFTGRGTTPDIHGTLLAGIAHAVAPDAALLSAKTCQPHSPQDIEARCWSVTLAKGLDWVMQSNAHVVNMSLGGPQDALLGRLVTAATSKGISVIAAAGNGGQDGRAPFPAALDSVVAVTSIDAGRRRDPHSTTGAFIDLAAPGVEILSTAPGARYLVSSGTSLAAAHASGAVALLVQQDHRRKPAELQSLLERTAQDLGAPGKDPLFGSGLVDICAATRACR